MVFWDVLVAYPVGLIIFSWFLIFALALCSAWFILAWKFERKKARIIESILSALTDEQIIDSVKYVEGLMRKTRYQISGK